MKIAILGTRGIPNYYGGFEQITESLSLHFAKVGHEVTVYNTDEHPYKKNEWHGVRIKHLFCLESKLSVLGTLIYDYLCLQNAISEGFDIILELGYVPSALFFRFNKKISAKIVTNMDGLEWKRTKWNILLRRFAKYCEASAVLFSDALISDNPGIREYILEEYNKDSIYIGYGARPFDSPSEEVLKQYELEKYRYDMLIARLEPENSIEIILDGLVLSKYKKPLIVVGNPKTRYGKYLLEKYKGCKQIRFLGGIYNYESLSSLRFFSRYYFHGHSVGGTNPSLLEAMASNACIVAHDNPFNRSVLGKDAFYFRDKQDIARVMDSSENGDRKGFTERNREKIAQIYKPDLISMAYLKLFEEIMREGEQPLLLKKGA